MKARPSLESLQQRIAELEGVCASNRVWCQNLEIKLTVLEARKLELEDQLHVTSRVLGYAKKIITTLLDAGPREADEALARRLLDTIDRMEENGNG